MTETAMLLHGTCVALGGKAALLRGEPGAGKSDLAYRFINLPPSNPQQPTALVADDQVELFRRDDKILVSPPKTIAGKIELRGIGIVEVPYIDEAMLSLVIDLLAPGKIERLPDWKSTAEILGLPIAKIELAPFEASAALKLRAAIEKAQKNNQD